MYFIVGWLSLFLGVIGIFLPLLPTTPFVLLAVACFARSSNKFHRWLLEHKYFGHIIENWNSHRCIEPRIKRKATLLILCSFSISIYFVPIVLVRFFLIALMAGLLYFIWNTADYPTRN